MLILNKQIPNKAQLVRLWLIKNDSHGPGRVAQLGRVSSQHAKVAGSIPGQGTDKNQPMSA